MASRRKAEALLALGKSLGPRIRDIRKAPPLESVFVDRIDGRDIKMMGVELLQPRLKLFKRQPHLFLFPEGLVHVLFPFISHKKPPVVMPATVITLMALKRRKVRKAKRKLRKLRKKYRLFEPAQ